MSRLPSFRCRLAVSLFFRWLDGSFFIYLQKMSLPVPWVCFVRKNCHPVRTACFLLGKTLFLFAFHLCQGSCSTRFSSKPLQPSPTRVPKNWKTKKADEVNCRITYRMSSGIGKICTEISFHLTESVEFFFQFKS